MKKISDLVSEKPGAADEAFGNGVHITGKKYVLTKADGRSAYAREVR